MNTLLVVDASSIVMLLTEPSTSAQQVADRVAGSQPHAPDHLPVEVTNVIRRYRKASLLTATEARLTLDAFWAIPIELWPLEVLRERVWELGDNLTAYDAAYVALAERLDAPLLTADARIARAPGPRCVIEVAG
ncbi:MAG: type II toxin-antitoxin system VapC family toxin [Pseudolysinimonas sp.]